jgi:hypothetical protein
MLLNENVFKVLATAAVKKDSIYSISLKVSDGRFANKLPYIRPAEAFLATHHSNLDSQWQKVKELVSRYNQKATEITGALQNGIREKMRDHFPGLLESDHFHLVSQNYLIHSLDGCLVVN